MYYTSEDGRQILDGTAGLWCVNAGHAHPKITQAIVEQAQTMDFGTHRIFAGTVRHVDNRSGGAELVYCNGAFRQLDPS